MLQVLRLQSELLGVMERVKMIVFEAYKGYAIHMTFETFVYLYVTIASLILLFGLTTIVI